MHSPDAERPSPSEHAQAGEEDKAKQNVLRRLQEESRELGDIDAAAIWQRTQTLIDLLYTRVQTCREKHKETEQSHTTRLQQIQRERENERAQRKSFFLRAGGAVGATGASALLAAHLYRRLRNRSRR